MAEVVGLNGKPVTEEIPRRDRPEDVLQTLLDEILSGKADVARLIVIVEGSVGKSTDGYFTRTSLATTAEAIGLTVIGQRIIVDGVLDV